MLHPANFMLEGEREPEVHKPRQLEPDGTLPGLSR